MLKFRCRARERLLQGDFATHVSFFRSGILTSQVSQLMCKDLAEPRSTLRLILASKSVSAFPGLDHGLLDCIRRRKLSVKSAVDLSSRKDPQPRIILDQPASLFRIRQMIVGVRLRSGQCIV